MHHRLRSGTLYNNRQDVLVGPRSAPEVFLDRHDDDDFVGYTPCEIWSVVLSVALVCALAFSGVLA